MTGGAAYAKEKTHPSIKSTSVDHETPLKGAVCDKKEKAKEGIETDPLSLQTKNEHTHRP
jgi:hypothetical protein